MEGIKSQNVNLKENSRGRRGAVIPKTFHEGGIEIVWNKTLYVVSGSQ